MKAKRISSSAAVATPPAKSPLLTRRLSEVVPRRVPWLWPGRIPLGMLTLLAGMQGLGKSSIFARLAAHITTGEPWPDGSGQRCEPGSVIMLCAEDSPEFVVRPRCHAAGADVDRIHLVEGVRDEYRHDAGDLPFRVDRDLEWLGRLCRSIGDVRAIFFDPLDSYLGEGVNVDKSHEVRPPLQSLVRLAHEHDVAVLGIKHLRKGAAEVALYRVAGAGAYTEVPRVVLMLDEVEDDLQLGTVKSNISRRPPDLALSIRGVDVDGEDVGVVNWLDDEPESTVKDSLSERVARRLPAKRKAAVDWLRGQLAGGPRLMIDLQTAWPGPASWRTVERAKREAGVVSLDVTPGTGEQHRWALAESLT